MSIKYVILGYVSWRPMSGYDVKKIIAASETLPWSANNNQIYRALVAMQRDGWVTRTVQAQEGAPNRHQYAITDAGRAALQQWVLSEPEAPASKKTFFYQLMWAEGVDTEALDQLLDAYLNVVGEKLFFLRVAADTKPDMPQRTAREQLLWQMMQENWIAHYELELRWVRQLRQQLSRPNRPAGQRQPRYASE